MGKYIVIRQDDNGKKYSEEKIEETRVKLEKILNDENNLFPYEIDRKEFLMDAYQELTKGRSVLISLAKNGLAIDDDRLVESIRKLEILSLLVDYLVKDLKVSVDNNKNFQKRK